MIGKDIDEMLKSIILTFEGLKDRIYSWLEEQFLVFKNLFDQLGDLSKEVVNWSCVKMKEIDRLIDQ